MTYWCVFDIWQWMCIFGHMWIYAHTWAYQPPWQSTMEIFYLPKIFHVLKNSSMRLILLMYSKMPSATFSTGTLLYIRSQNLVILYNGILHLFLTAPYFCILMSWWTLPSCLVILPSVSMLRIEDCLFLYRKPFDLWHIWVTQMFWVCSWWWGNMDIFWSACKPRIIPFVSTLGLLSSL